MFHATPDIVCVYEKSQRHCNGEWFATKTSFQLLLPTQDIPRIALANVIIGMLVKGSSSTYPVSKTFPAHICFWLLQEISPG